MNILLDHQQVYQGLVDYTVGPVPVAMEQAAEGVFHCSCNGSKNVCFYGRQVNYVLTDECFGDENTIWVNFIQHQEWTLGLVLKPLEAFFVKVYTRNPRFICHKAVFIIHLADGRVHYNRIVMDAYYVLVSTLFQCLDDPFDLPGRGGARRIPSLPGDIDL